MENIEPGIPVEATTPVSMITAVSSAQRPVARITPLIIPERDWGSKILIIFCNLLAPSAGAVILNRTGTPSRAAWVVRII